MEKSLKLIAISFIMILSFFHIDNASAYISVEPKILDLANSDASIKILNNGDRIEHVNISLYKVNNPGVEVGDEILTNIGDISDPPLYAFPFKLSIGANEKKVVKIRSLKDVRREEVYRLTVTPVIKYSSNGNLGNFFIINVAYNLLVRKVPSVTRPLWSFKCKNGEVILYSTGNSRLKIRLLNNTPIEYSTFNLYPGEVKQFEENFFHGTINNKKVDFKCS